MEKRQFQRMDKTIKVQYESNGMIKNFYQTSFTRDVSVGGFLIRVRDNLEVNSEIDLKVYLETEQRFVKIKATVVRVKTIVQNKLYDVGVKLSDIHNSDYILLSKYLNENS